MATWFFAGLLVAVFVVQFFTGMNRSIEAAGMVKPFVFQFGQYWRLLTCTVLHGDVLHIAFNVVALVALGRLIEAHAHPVYLPVTFLFSAICGSLASLYMTPDGPPSIGASGGLMGMIGFLLVMGYRRKEVLPPGFLKSILFSIALILGIGMIAAGMIDNAAHLGGLAGGVLLGLVYVTRRRTRNYRLQPSAAANLAGVMCMGVIVLIATLAIWKIVKFVKLV
jgi:membrane associated rhomboid family serine protease